MGSQSCRPQRGVLGASGNALENAVARECTPRGALAAGSPAHITETLITGSNLASAMLDPPRIPPPLREHSPGLIVRALARSFKTDVASRYRHNASIVNMSLNNLFDTLS